MNTKWSGSLCIGMLPPKSTERISATFYISGCILLLKYNPYTRYNNFKHKLLGFL
jgi:hypothetical protein